MSTGYGGEHVAYAASAPWRAFSNQQMQGGAWSGQHRHGVDTRKVEPRNDKVPCFSILRNTVSKGDSTCMRPGCKANHDPRSWQPLTRMDAIAILGSNLTGLEGDSDMVRGRLSHAVGLIVQAPRGDMSMARLAANARILAEVAEAQAQAAAEPRPVEQPVAHAAAPPARQGYTTRARPGPQAHYAAEELDQDIRDVPPHELHHMAASEQSVDEEEQMHLDQGHEHDGDDGDDEEGSEHDD